MGGFCRVFRFTPKVGQIGTKWDKYETLKIFEPKCSENDLQNTQICPIWYQSNPLWDQSQNVLKMDFKSHRFVALDANLPRFWPKPDTPGSILDYSSEMPVWIQMSLIRQIIKNSNIQVCTFLLPAPNLG